MNGSESALGDWRDVRPSAEQSHRYRRLGLWRDETPTADLRRWARETPDAVAVTAYRAGSGVRRLTYREYQEQVESFAVALRRPGNDRGDRHDDDLARRSAGLALQPRNATGKVRKELLRRWLRGETELPS
jgi:non-ribosomal peptide synthetase component E (peptide arylation enzyme)